MMIAGLKPVEMRPRLLRATVIGLIVVGLAFIVPTSASADAQTFKDHCAKCHARPQTLARQLKGDTPEAKRLALDGFLATHHANDAEVRNRIIDYLVALASN